jgi:tripartite-type tricarboxylate transporter receptor subunit TctC
MFPDVPTLKELGINWSAGTWRGVAVPKGTPSEIRKILEDAIIEIANSESFKNFMQTNGFGIKIRRGQEFYEFIKQQDQAWKRVLELGGYLQK